jgi:hypothetical protein
MALTVDEASGAYERAMRNMALAGDGVCRICWTFTRPGFSTCYPCGFQPEMLDLVVPITYSEHLGQMHTALRNYKDGSTDSVKRYAAVRLAAVLWRFLSGHEACIARELAVDAFPIVAVVPSSSPERERRSPLWELLQWIEPLRDRLERILEPTGEVTGREYNSARFRHRRRLAGEPVLLLDDTWTTGGHAQSAAHALLAGGASKVALVMIGRHVRRGYELTPDTTAGALLDDLPDAFDWDTCAVHSIASA